MHLPCTERASEEGVLDAMPLCTSNYALEQAIERFNETSTAQSAQMIRLTQAIVGLTVALVARPDCPDRLSSLGPDRRPDWEGANVRSLPSVEEQA